MHLNFTPMLMLMRNSAIRCCCLSFAAFLLLQGFPVRSVAENYQADAREVYALSGSEAGKQRHKNVKDVYVTFQFDNVNAREVFRKIREATGFSFSYNKSDVEGKKVTGKYKNQTLYDVLVSMSRQLNVEFRQYQDVINVKVREEETGKGEAVEEEQTITVRGVVTDGESGEPLPGVNVIIQGTSQGTVTDINGSYSVSVPEKGTLVFSFIGYVTEEVPVNSREVIDISMVIDIQSLQEVVVVGYGTQKKENVTAAISTIQAEEITTTVNASLAQSLQGKIPGLQIRQQNGEPGSFTSTINIRGFGEPLYVIDGIVRDGGVEFQQLNPNDIESISILKDASAAIYGLNASNGVIVVTTKKGKQGPPRFNYSGAVGLQTPTYVPEMSTAAQYLEMYNSAIFHRDGVNFISQEELAKWRAGEEGYESTDWYDETFKDYAMQQQHNFSISGGGEDVNYFVSLGYFNEGGLFKSGDINYERFNLRSNLNARLGENLTADLMLSGRYGKREAPGGDGFMWIYKGTIISHPTEKPFIDGNPLYPASIYNQQNPVLMSDKDYAGYTNNENKAFQSSASLTYEAPFLKGLQAKSTIAYDNNTMFNKNVWKSYRVYSQDLSSQLFNPPRIANAVDDINRVVFQGQLSYENSFAGAHNVSATVVFEQKYYKKKYAYLKREYDFYTLDIVDYAAGLQTNEGREEERATTSYIGRINYDYLGKYLVGYAFRYDGSYRYAPGKRWGFFPAVSAGWRISQENFIKDNLLFVNNLKLRASYGMIGEEVGDPFQHVLGFSPRADQGAEFQNGVVTGGMVAPGVINPHFTWVESTIRDIGIEGALFNNKLTFEADYYEREKTGKLKTREGGLPNTFGGDMPIENLEDELTRGFDFIVGHENRVRDFTYGVSANMNLARTMHTVVDKPEPTSSRDRWRHGFPDRWNDLVWGYEKIGQFQNQEEINNAPIHGGNQGNTQILPGDYRYKDVNGDGVINGHDELPIFRNRTPKLFYGLSLAAGYGNFDLTAVFQGAALYNIRYDEVFSSMFFNDGNLPAYFYDRWHLENPGEPGSGWVPGKWPASRFADDMQSSYRESSAWRMNASFLRMKSLEIGYTFPKRWVESLHLQSVRIYGNAHNLLTFTDPFLKQFDPEKYEGKDYKVGYDYPLMQSFNFGVNVSF